MDSAQSTTQQSDWLASLLQTSDPLFPSGAYAHSMGLEQWAHFSGYRDEHDLVRFFKQHAGPALTRLELPYLRFAFEALTAGDWPLVFELDQEIDAWKWSAELREASIAQGRSRLRMLRKLWPEDENLKKYAAALTAKEVFGHQLTVTALQHTKFGLPLEAVLTAYAYQSLANYVSASIKLLRISPEAAQVSLREGVALLSDWISASKTVERPSAGWFAPAFDIQSARHATAFSRLFIS